VGWGKVFVAKDLYTIAALDMTTGEELWSTKISDVNTTGIDIQPSVYDGMVYVSTVPGTADIFYAPGGIGVIYALDQQTGKVAWQFSTVDSPDLWGHKEVNSGGGCWYPPSVDTDTGMMFWGTGNPAPFPGTEEWPSGSSRPGPNLYTDSIVALDHGTGEMKWFTQVYPHDLFDLDFQISPILASANISGKQQDIVIGAGKMGRVYAFSRQTGAILWVAVVGEHQNDQLDVLPNGTTRVQPSVLGGVETPMAYSDGVVYVPVVNMYTDWTPSAVDFASLNFSAGKGELVAVDANTGKILWSKVFSSINVGGATVVNDLVFTATYDGTIYGFNKATGEQVFSTKAPAGINAWPAVAGNMIVWPAGVGGVPSLIALKI
jgi:outer membrane protein assembly factor BamB